MFEQKHDAMRYGYEISYTTSSYIKERPDQISEHLKSFGMSYSTQYQLGPLFAAVSKCHWIV